MEGEQKFDIKKGESHTPSAEGDKLFLAQKVAWNYLVPVDRMNYVTISSGCK